MPEKRCGGGLTLGARVVGEEMAAGAGSVEGVRARVPAGLAAAGLAVAGGEGARAKAAVGWEAQDCEQCESGSKSNDGRAKQSQRAV